MSDTFRFPEGFQNLILACTIAHPDKFSRYGPLLDASYFQGVMATVAARSVTKYFKDTGRYPKWDTLTLLVCEDVKRKGGDDEMEKAQDFVQGLRSMETDDVDYVVNRLRDFARERATINAIREAVKMLKDGKTPDAGFVKMMEEAVNVGQDLDDLGYVFHSDYERVIDKITSRTYGIKTGFPQLDNHVWRRGLGPGWLIVPLAPPKRYKSLFISAMALNMVGPSIGRDVLYYACEIDQTLTIKRMLQRLTQSEEDFIWESPEKFRLKARESVNNWIAGNLIVKEFPSKTATIGMIKAHAKMVIQQLGLNVGAIFIDYAETVRPSDTSISEPQQQASIYVEARAMGAELQCPVIMPDRANKETVGMAVPSMTSFQGSFQKAGVVDGAIGLCATDDEYEDKVQRTFIFLNRHGQAFQHFRGTVDPEHMDINLGDKLEEKYVVEEKGKGKGKKSRGSEVATTATYDDLEFDGAQH